MLALAAPLRQSEPVPQVINIRHLPGFGERQPIIPPGAVYIGRPVPRAHIAGSKWGNPFKEMQRRTQSPAISIAPGYAISRICWRTCRATAVPR